MTSEETSEEPSYLGNLLFLIGSFYTAGIAAGTIATIVGNEGIIGYTIAAVVFVAVFIGLLLFYNSYYLTE